MDEHSEFYESRRLVCLGMRTFGGGFVKALGMALIVADYENSLKIMVAFPNYWTKYKAMGKGVER